MNRFGKAVAVLIGLALAVPFVLTLMHSPEVVGALGVGAVGLKALISIPVSARPFQQLNVMANPVEAGQGEAIPHILYDTQLYTSGATTTLTYFSATQTDRTLSNLQAGGQLPDPQWFEIHNLGFDVLADGTTNAAATELGIYDDIQKLMLVGRPIFTLQLSDKNYGPYPLSFLHTSGGAQGALTGTVAASAVFQFANNSIPDGGWNWRGAVIIPPKVGFQIGVQFSAAQTLAAGNTQLRFWMAGVLQRRVL